MIYKNFREDKISALGLGCMRFPTACGSGGEVDMDAVRRLVKLAVDGGINYFDTAWAYHGGRSERVIGEVLSEYPRESYRIATKFPGYDLSHFDRIEEIFEEQLKRCRVDYFDFYLFHNVCESNIDAYLDEERGLFKFLSEQKRRGRIKHLGFSTHGRIGTVRRFLDAYGKDMEFCQIQLNWLDWKLQDAKAKVELLREYNIPIWVMEPVRGGALARLQPEHSALLREARAEASDAEWAFRYIQSFPEVVVTLSGMSSEEQICENIKTFSENKPTSDKETALLYEIAAKMTEKDTLPCTACRYCTDYCPRGLDIPHIIQLYNEYSYSGGGGFLVPMAIGAMPEDKKPSACIGCRRCESVCPQNIKISEMMSSFARKLAKEPEDD
ncbi:MAG: aldo/keto reductase [Clostridia bacterium]|nr:aldo/keto reductase [Clostridia bacterium]